MNKRANTQIQWTYIASGIRQAIERGELRPGERLASETELAEQWSVSTMTVHRAMQELQRAGWVNRRRRIGTFVVDRDRLPTRRIALIFANIATMPEAEYMRGIRDTLPANIRLLHQDTRCDCDREAACIRQVIQDNEADGIICYATCDPVNTQLWLDAARKKPLVFVDRIPAGIEQSDARFDAVMTDNRLSMRNGLDALEARGHTRIAYFMEQPWTQVSSVSERQASYREFMTRMYPESPHFLERHISRTLPPDDYFDRAYEHLQELTSGRGSITAVACQQDKVLAAVLEASVRLRITVPEGLEILSFSEFGPYQMPLGRSVHRIVQRSTEMGGMAARRLMMRFENPDLPVQIMRVAADIHPATIPGPLSENKLPVQEARLDSSPQL